MEQADRIDGQLVYAVGDVHGRYDLLKEMLGLIAADLREQAPRSRPFLVFCGDYVDRGPDSAETLEALIWLKRDDRFRLRMLKGNHEDALLGFMQSPETRGRWLRVGGRATLESYGVDCPRDPDDPQACRLASEALATQMPAAHQQLLGNLELSVIIGDYAFVHAGIRPEVSLARQSPHDLMWIREGFLGRTERFEKRVVHGHSWTGPEPEVRSNRIGIDTGAFKTGVLTAVRITDAGFDFLRTGVGPVPIGVADPAG